MSLLPRCSSVGAIISAATLGEALQLFAGAALDSLVAIFTESYISLVAVLLIFALCLSFAAAGGVGALTGDRPYAQHAPADWNELQRAEPPMRIYFHRRCALHSWEQPLEMGSRALNSRS